MDEKHPTQSQSKNENQVENGLSNLTKPATTAKRVTSKRWLYPSIYLGAAALIIGLMYVKSQMASSPTSSTDATDTGAAQTQTTTTTAAQESFEWPVGSGSGGYKVTLGFFPEKGTPAEQAAALVMYDHTYYPHQGLDIKGNTAGTLNVTAAVSGKVTKVEDQPLMGKTVEVTSANGYVEDYESLGSIDVKEGQQVSQGQQIGTAGTSQFEPNQGNHLYFEVLQDGNPIDPTTLLPKQ